MFVLWSGGPLTNFALALALDPKLPEKVKALTVMGGGIDVARYRREFNWWWGTSTSISITESTTGSHWRGSSTSTKPRCVPSSTVQFDLDSELFYDLYVELMTRP